MSELTKEYFDQVVSGLASKNDLAPLATSQQVEELAPIVADGFSELQTRLDVTEQIKAFERKFQKLDAVSLAAHAARSPHTPPLYYEVSECLGRAVKYLKTYFLLMIWRFL